VGNCPDKPLALSKHGLEEVVLHLPASLRDRAEEMAMRESVSLNLFVVMAVAEKLQRLQLEHCLDVKGEDRRAGLAGEQLPLIH
jgi:hypothetical protein